jgi:hypothetical protein
MDLAAITNIAVTIILTLVVSVSVQAVFFISLKPYLERRLDRKLAHARRFTASQTRQTAALITKAVAGFDEQASFLNDRCDSTVKECIRAVNTTREKMAEQLRTALTPTDNAQGPRGRAPLPISVEQIRKKAEDRLVEQLNEEALQPKGS